MKRLVRTTVQTRSSIAALWAGLLGPACAGSEATIEPLVPDDPRARLERTFFANHPAGGSVFGGYDGAFDPGLSVRLFEPQGSQVADLLSDANGRVEVKLEEAPLELALFLGDDGTELVTYAARDPRRAREEAVKAPLSGAGSVPNDLLLLGAKDQTRMILVRSGDNALSVLDPERGLSEQDRGLRFPELDTPRGPAPAVPWFVIALDADGTKVLVSAFGQRQVYLIDVTTLNIDAVFAVKTEVVLEQRFVLAAPFDLDGDGEKETELDRFLPASIQGLAVSEGALFAGFSGFLAPRRAGQPPIYLPGVVARWSIEEPDRAPVFFVLPVYNPQELRALEGGLIAVTCSGILDLVAGRNAATSEGAVLVLDQAGVVVEQHLLGDFAPSSSVFLDGAIWVSSLTRARLMRIDRSAPGRREVMELNSDPIDSIFRLLALPGGLLAAPSFNSDQLHFVDTRSGLRDPPPFFGPLLLGPGRPVFDGLQLIARRPGRFGIDFVGPDLFALAGVASRITPVELRKLFGP